MLDAIEQWHMQSSTRVLLSLIIGNPGMGKSVLASQLCTMASQNGILAACFFFQHHKIKRNNARALVQTLAYQLCLSIPNYKYQIEKYLNEETLFQMNVFELFTDLVLEPLHKIPDISQHMLILIDGLDECDFDERGELLKLILREFVRLPKWIRVIMTTRPDKIIIKKLSKIKPVFSLRPDDPRNIIDIRMYLNDILKEKMKVEELEKGIEMMLEKSEGMFLYFHYACEAINYVVRLTLNDLKTLLPDGIHDFYEQNFRRLHKKLGKEKYQILFQAILAARSDFPQKLFGPLLNASDAESSEIINTISVLLPVHNEYVNLFHKSITDWLTDRDLAEDLVIDPTSGHINIAEICYEKFNKLKQITPTKAGLDIISKYVIEHTVYHLYSANSQSLAGKLCGMVTDLQYMFYKLLLCGSAKDLMDDLAEAKRVVTSPTSLRQNLQQCTRFVHRYAQTLSSMPQMVFQCAINDPQNAAYHLCLDKYVNNPSQYFPGLELFLELIEKPQHLASAITEYHCENDITSLTESPDEKLLICSDSHGKIYVWDKYTGDLLHESIHNKRDFMFPIVRCSLPPEGDIILYGNPAEVLSIEGTPVPFIANVNDDPYEVNTCIFSPNGNFFVSWNYYVDGVFRLLAEIGMNEAAHQFTLRIWDRTKGIPTTLESVRRKEVRPLCVSISHDSKYVACGHRDGRILLWETDTKNQKGMLLTDGTTIRNGPFKSASSPKDDPVKDIAYSLNGYFIAACHNKGITIWDAATLNFIQDLFANEEMAVLHPNVRFRSCSFSANSNNLIAGLSNGYIHLWNKQPSQETTYTLQLSVKPRDTDPVTTCFLDSKQQVVCALRSSICIYAYDSLLKIPATTQSVAQHPGYATDSLFLPDGKTALTCGNGSLNSWNISDACQISKASSTVFGHLMNLSADGKLAITFGEGSLIQVWDTEFLEMKTSVCSQGSTTSQGDPDSSSPQDICSCAVSIHGIVVGGTGEGHIYIWHGENTRVFKEHEALITCMAFSCKGDSFVSCDMEGGIIMCQITKQNKDEVSVRKIPMQSHDDSIEDVLFSVGQLQRIVSCGSDDAVHMYNGLNGEIIRKLEGHSSVVLKIAYSASGELLISGDGGGHLILWDGFTGKLIQHLNPSSGHSIINVYFSGEDKYVCSEDSARNFVQVFSVSSGVRVSQINFSSAISAFAASSLKTESQSHMICGLKDGSIQFLKLVNTSREKSSDVLAPKNLELSDTNIDTGYNILNNASGSTIIEGIVGYNNNSDGV